MKKKLLVLAVIGLMMSGCGKIPTLKNGEEAVVTFKDSESISVDELYNNIKDSYALNALIDMIDNKILYIEYKDKDSEIDEYVKNNLDSMKEYYKTDDELIQAFNSYYGTGFQDIQDFKDYLALNYLRNLATEDYAKSKVTDKSIENYYKNTTVGDIEASHILITPEVKDDMSDEEKTKAEEAALKEAKDIIEKLNNGEDFAELAKKYSDDTASAKNGGALGKFNKGDMVESFETAAYALKVNEYTKEPVESEHGYHIILKTKEYDKPELKDVKDEITETLAKEKMQNDSTISITAITELRKKYDFKITDSELATQYNKYINNLYQRATSTTSTTKSSK
mgnify:CR=1 FL=1